MHFVVCIHVQIHVLYAILWAKYVNMFICLAILYAKFCMYV
jgi:hypothetical protein